jgi:hypothetical protein
LFPQLKEFVKIDCGLSDEKEPCVVTNLKRLSDALDKAAPPAGEAVVAEIRSDMERINREVAQKGVSYITVDGRRFKVLRTVK